MEWSGRVIEAEGDLFTAILSPSDRDAPELVADFSMSRCGIRVEPGDLIKVTPESVAKVDLGTWTQEDIDAIRYSAEELAALLNENVE